MYADSRQEPHWYAIQTRSRHEKMVRDQLAAKSIKHLLPLWRKRSIWKDRVRYVEVPLFSGYLFGRIVGVNGTAVPVPDEQIAAVLTMVEHRLPYDPHPYLVEGMRVRIKCGVLMGAEGILTEKRQRHRLVISMDLIQQGVAVEVDIANVEPLELRPQGACKPSFCS